MNERSRIKKAHELATGDQFVAWIAQRGGSEFAFFSQPKNAPDLVYKCGDTTLNIEHSSAQYDVAHRILTEWPVCANGNIIEYWFGEGNVDEVLANSVVDVIQKKCQKAANGRYGSDPILLVEVLPGVTTAEALKWWLRKKEKVFSDMPFAGVYVVGRFPFTARSKGGFRVLPIKESSLTLTLSNRDGMDEALYQVFDEEEEEAWFMEGFETA